MAVAGRDHSRLSTPDVWWTRSFKCTASLLNAASLTSCVSGRTRQSLEETIARYAGSIARISNGGARAGAMTMPFIRSRTTPGYEKYIVFSLTRNELPARRTRNVSATSRQHATPFDARRSETHAPTDANANDAQQQSEIARGQLALLHGECRHRERRPPRPDMVQPSSRHFFFSRTAGILPALMVCADLLADGSLRSIKNQSPPEAEISSQRPFVQSLGLNSNKVGDAYVDCPIPPYLRVAQFAGTHEPSYLRSCSSQVTCSVRNSAPEHAVLLDLPHNKVMIGIGQYGSRYERAPSSSFFQASSCRTIRKRMASGASANNSISPASRPFV